MAVDKKQIIFFALGGTALVLSLLGLRRLVSAKMPNDVLSINLPDSNYTLSYDKYKGKYEKDNGIVFTYSGNGKASAKKIENLTKQSFNIFDKYKIDVDSISNRPFFDVTITDLKDSTIVVKQQVR